MDKLKQKEMKKIRPETLHGRRMKLRKAKAQYEINGIRNPFILKKKRKKLKVEIEIFGHLLKQKKKKKVRKKLEKKLMID